MGLFSGKALGLGLLPGLLGGKEKPTMEIPAAPKYKQADELFGTAMAFGKSNQPFAYGAREGALNDLSKGSDYYASFSPTSFEQALSDQYFKNVYPGMERQIKHGLSLSGIESTPVLADSLGKAYGNVAFDVGSYLSNLGNQRAQYSLSNRLGIDPSSTYNNYLNTDMNQSNTQVGADYQYAMQKAMADFQKQMEQYQQQQAMISALTTAAGAAGGFALGGPAGASIGAGLGGASGPLFGGGQAPINFGDAIAMANYFKPQPVMPGYGGYGQNTPMGTTNAGKYSVLPQPVF